MTDLEHWTAYQDTDEGKVAELVKAVSAGMSDLSIASMSGKVEHIKRQRADLEVAYSQLGRLLSRIRPRAAA